VQGFLAAPSTPRDQPVGLVFDQCRLTREAQVPNASAYLGRPWRAGGNMSLLPAAAYLDCWMDAHIRPEGWTHMHYRAPGGPEQWLEPSDARFFEYRSRGPGAAVNPARRQLSPADLPRYERAAMFGGWRP
jgi:pectinesterase